MSGCRLLGLAPLPLLILLAAPTAQGQAEGTATVKSARDRALIDLTGQWVSIVTEDWRWRMVTPPKGDTPSVPLTPAGKKAAENWDLAGDRARGALCKAFGPPGLIRQPGRIRVAWKDDNTLRLEFDAGTQVRDFHFESTTPVGARSVQGYSAARWYRQAQERGVFLRVTPTSGGSLVVTTTNLRAGYLRPNGVPYSDRAVVKEFFDAFTLPDAGSWLIVTTVVNDPEYLTDEFVISSQFKKEADTSGWRPRPCDIPPPVVAQ
jgi:hypothetical protein